MDVEREQALAAAEHDQMDEQAFSARRHSFNAGASPTERSTGYPAGSVRPSSRAPVSVCSQPFISWAPIDRPPVSTGMTKLQEAGR